MSYKPINNPSGTTSFKNLSQLRTVVIEISKTGMFKQQTEVLYDSWIFNSPNEEITLTPEAALPIKTAFFELTFGVKALTEAINEILTDSVPESIYVKLPETSDLKELSKYINDFDKALSQSVINDETQGTVVLKNVQSGSVWLEIFLGTSAAVTLVGRLFWAAAVIAKKEQEAKMVEQQVRGLQIKNESLVEILEAQKAATKLMIQTEAERVFKEGFSNNDPEQVTRLGHAIVTFAELIQKGAELQPSLNASENVKNLFPKSGEMAMIESKTKQIDKQ